MAESSGEPLRLFAAARLPDVVQREVEGLLGRLQAGGLPGWRWVQPEGLHLTLRFLGETPPERAASAAEAVRRAGGGSAPFPLALDGAGVFGGWRPRVLWVGLSGDLEALQRLAERLNEELRVAGWDAPARPLRPHITLARARRSATAAQAAAAKVLAEGVEAGGASFEISALELVESRLRPEGARYRVAASARLAGAVE